LLSCASSIRISVRIRPVVVVSLILIRPNSKSYYSVQPYYFLVCLCIYIFHFAQSLDTVWYIWLQ